MRFVCLLGMIWVCLLSACSETDGYQRMVVEDQFSVEVPLYLSEAENMHIEAPLQMENPYKRIYLLGRFDRIPVQTPDEDGFVPTLEDYYIQTFKQVLPNMPVPYPDSLVLDGLPAMRIRTESNFKGQQLLYDLTLIEGQQYLYQILTWCEMEEVLEFEAAQNHIVSSFEEL